MSDYTQTTYFATKDNLASGDAAKVIKGSEVDAELLAIQNAIATKVEEGSFPSGTIMLFYQAAAPTDWTKSTGADNYGIRVVNSTGGGTGGSVDFTTAFSNQTVSGTSGATTLSASQIPTHTHHVRGPTVNSATSPANYAAGNTSGTSTGGVTGSPGGSHTHSFSDTVDLRIKYIDVIVCTKD